MSSPGKLAVSNEFMGDFASAPSEVREEVIARLPLVARNPAEYGFFLSGNWRFLQWIDIAGAYGLVWQADPFMLVRLLPLGTDGRPGLQDGFGIYPPSHEEE